MRLRKSTFRYIEQEIYDYEKTRKRIEEIRTEIILSTVTPHEIRTPDPKDPTGMTTTRLMLDSRLKSLEFVADSIKNIMIRMVPEVLDILLYKYWRYPKMQWSTVSIKFNVDEKTLYRWRREFIEEIAKDLGAE